jgi:membrane protein required for colicin V production
MNWVTILVLALLAFMTFRAFRNGFVRELVSLSAVILAIPIAGVLYGHLANKLQPIVDNMLLSRLIAFLAIMASVIIVGQVVAHLLKQTVALLNLGGADHLAGAAFGLLKGIIVCQVVLLAFVVFPSPDLRDSIDESPVAKKLLDTTPAVLLVLPGRFDGGVHAFLDNFHPSSQPEQERASAR